MPGELLGDNNPPAGPASEFPLQYIEGQPISVEQARTKMEELPKDENWVKRRDANDPAVRTEWQRLWRVSRGVTPDPLPESTPEEVRATMHERDRQLDDQRINGYAKYFPVNDEKRAQMRRGLCTQQQHDEAVMQIERMSRDPAFRIKVLNNDMDAKARWQETNFVAAMKIAPADYDWSKDKAGDFQG
jgi:hypothetical protein